MFPNIYIGFAGNAELTVGFDPNSQEAKIPADAFSVGLAGSSITVARALRRLTGGQLNPNIMLATSVEGDWKDVLLEHLLKQESHQYTLLSIREPGGTGIAAQLTMPDRQSKIVGRKGVIVRLPVDEIQAIVSRDQGSFRVATGVKSEEAPLVHALYSDSAGTRVLNPNVELCRNHRAFRKLLAEVDMLVWNDFEFGQFVGKKCQFLGPLDFAELAKLGVPLIAVTINCSGSVLICRGEVMPIPAAACGECVSGVGAGDWWLGAFLSMVIQRGITDLRNIPQEAALEAAKHASYVSGIKVTHNGGAGDGPELAEIQGLR